MYYSLEGKGSRAAVAVKDPGFPLFAGMTA
jgi:hypothetical protein